MNLHALLAELATVLETARENHAPMHSPHEGWSVIFEELEELREHVRRNTGRGFEARSEAMQIAAMGLRYVIDLCPVERSAMQAMADRMSAATGYQKGLQAALATVEAAEDLAEAMKGIEDLIQHGGRA